VTTGEETRDVGLGRPAVSLLHRDPPISTVAFFGPRMIWLPLVIAAALTLAVLASHDGGRILDTVDEPVAEWIAEQRTDTWTDVFNSISRLGDNIVVFAIGAVLAAITWRRCRYLAIAFVVAAAFRPGLEFVLKAVIDRERPDISPLGEFAGPSHPSGHPMAAAALFGLVPAFVALHTHRAWLWWVSLVASATVVVGVAASRAYKGAHYLTDVTASLLWASLFLLVVQAIFDRFHRDRDCRHPQHETQVDAD
jgi:membrane-associated phospholipid phosphatase